MTHSVVDVAHDLGCQGDGIRVRHPVTPPWSVLAVEHAIRQPFPGHSRRLLTPGVGVAVAEQMGQGDVVQSVRATCHDLDEVLDARGARMRPPEHAVHRAVADHAAPSVTVPYLSQGVGVPWATLSYALCTPTILPPFDRPVTLSLPLLLGEAGPSVLIEHVERPLTGASPADLDDMEAPLAVPPVLLRGAGALFVHESHSARVTVIVHRYGVKSAGVESVQVLLVTSVGKRLLLRRV